MNDLSGSTGTQTKKALMFGCGNMGQALISGWNEVENIEFTVVDPAKPVIADDVTVYGSAEDVKDSDFDLIVIAVKPQLIEDVIKNAPHLMRTDCLVLSIAAGTSMNTLQSYLGERPIVRMMPNMPASVKLGLSALYGNEKCGDADKAVIDAMATNNGKFIWLDEEDKIDRFTAIAGSGPGYFFEVLRLFAMAAMDLGFEEEDARMLAIGTVLGTAAMAEQSEKTLEDLRKSVTSKNGTTQAGLEQLMREDTLRQLFADTTQAAYNRAVELR
ncbi:pyrroline-5-carboxylate reductase [Ponticaulis sp.]|uniref:pyrroline-5-carboxylate reductase n=1 Tax=Ponticaulis sp. TaxID=2020902 RepID=UPI002635438A|nr:pyrroline-5-carboxylate reductase [Ponticaulis sp.]MDF1680327.1 pyrroline-5-carboxylate reductase [Ponticaulis sp.]